MLPVFSDYLPILAKNMKALAGKGEGIALIEDDTLLGFMAGYPIDAFFGRQKGIFVPVFGHGTVFSRRAELEQMLYVEAAEKWVKQARFTHSIAIFAHDEVLLDTWFHLGFGNRCVDAVRVIRSQPSGDPTLSFDEITIENASSVASLHAQHHRYYRSSPIFMPTPEEDALADLNDWLSRKGNRMFVVIYQGAVAGYIRYQGAGESLFSVHPRIRNITGLFVSPLFRHLGLGEKLSNHVESKLLAEGVDLVGVDYESINPKANRFWGRHFTPYTYSLVRRIDERMDSVCEESR